MPGEIYSQSDRTSVDVCGTCTDVQDFLTCPDIGLLVVLCTLCWWDARQANWNPEMMLGGNSEILAFLEYQPCLLDWNWKYSQNGHIHDKHPTVSWGIVLPISLDIKIPLLSSQPMQKYSTALHWRSTEMGPPLNYLQSAPLKVDRLNSRTYYHGNDGETSTYRPQLVRYGRQGKILLPASSYVNFSLPLPLSRSHSPLQSNYCVHLLTPFFYFSSLLFV